MNFTKMHGLGNDFIIIENNSNTDFSKLAKRLCDRRLGVGADGLLILDKSSNADFKMIIFNSDGSEAEMCGNGIRCFARYVFEKGYTTKTEFTVETLAGIIKPKLIINEGIAQNVRVNMGKIETDKKKHLNLNFSGKGFDVIYIMMGVPHSIVYVDAIKEGDIRKYGKLIEHHEIFKNGTNVNFVKVVNDGEIELKTWERGAGLTAACGTGACASAVVSFLEGFTGRHIKAKLKYGSLLIDYENDGYVYMTGPAVTVFDGSF